MEHLASSDKVDKLGIIVCIVLSLKIPQQFKLAKIRVIRQLPWQYRNLEKCTHTGIQIVRILGLYRIFVFASGPNSGLKFLFVFGSTATIVVTGRLFLTSSAILGILLFN